MSARDCFYSNCPAINGNARGLTNYQNPWSYENNLKTKNGIVREDDYRLFLQTNAKTLMDMEWNELKNTQSCWNNVCVHTEPSRQNPATFAAERMRANMALQSNTIPKNMICKRFMDARISK